jgi:hypothetical protein
MQKKELLKKRSYSKFKNYERLLLLKTREEYLQKK